MPKLNPGRFDVCDTWADTVPPISTMRRSLFPKASLVLLVSTSRIMHALGGDVYLILVRIKTLKVE